MNDDLPLYEPDTEATYQLDIVARITGISSETILHYQEQGLIRRGDLTDESVHALRRIDHLQSLSEANLEGLKLIVGLMDEIDHLRTELRARR